MGDCLIVRRGGGKGAFPTQLTVTTPPAKTSYKAGEVVDLTGMVVKARYSDGSTDDVTSECTFSPASGATVYEDTGKIAIEWAWEDITTFETAQAITVTRVLSSITITTEPAKTSYTRGETLDLDGMVVTAVFTSGKTEAITGYTTSPTSGSTMPSTGTFSVTVSYTENGITKTTSFTINVSAPIYGVSWDGTSTTKFSRTDAAASFTDPVPYVSGASSYGSPFDNISPWCDMQKVEDSTAGALVSIPKFYYKWTKTGTAMKLQISEESFDGSYVSPAHADRGDGIGERSIVYVGRYICNSSYKSTTGSTPLAKITRATARTNIHNLGSAYWQFDFAMYWTIAMLYLVEFADWNSQTKIGYGCGNGSAFEAVGASDSMPYHTGTMQSSRTTYGVGVQYRYIEGLWDNCRIWCDGIYFVGSSVYCIKNPSNFSDSSNGTNISARLTSDGNISAWNIPTSSGFEYALFPSAVAGSNSEYISDAYAYSSSGAILHLGGSYTQGSIYGLFFMYGDYSASATSSRTGCRLQKLP